MARRSKTCSRRDRKLRGWTHRIARKMWHAVQGDNNRWMCEGQILQDSVISELYSRMK